MNSGKIYETADAAVADIFDGAVSMLGGFGAPGLPQRLVEALVRQGASGLTVVCNTCFEPDPAEANVARLVESGQVKKLITTFFGRPNQETPAVELWRAGRLEVEIAPQGLLAERMRAAAAGLGGVYIPAYDGTEFENAGEIRHIGGKPHVLALPLAADYALIAGDAADPLGNLSYRLTQRNYNPTMAAAAAVTIAEVRRIEPVGGMDPELVVTPGLYVNRLVASG